MDVRSAAQTDHARSIAILIGVADADHTDHELRPVPATLNSLRAMQRVLTDPNLCGWPADRVTVLRNPEDAGRTARRLRDLVRSARDTLVVYYAGEASVTNTGQLCLALHDTEPDAPERTGLGYSWLARALRDSPARRKVVILDCSLPGRAGQFLDPVSDQIAELSDVEGVYTLTSTTRHHPAPVMNAMQQRPRPTVFTGQLVEIVEGGLPGGPLDLTFEDLYPALRQRLVSMGLPPPNQRGTGGSRPLSLTRNMAPRSAGAAAAATAPALAAAAAASSPPAPPDPPRPGPSATARLSGSSGSSGPSGSSGSSGSPLPRPGSAAGSDLAPAAAASVLGTVPDAGPALLPPPDPAPEIPPAPLAPSLLGRPGNGTRHNGHGSPTAPTTGSTPVVGSRPITGQTPVIGARPIAGPEPPRRTPGPDATPPPPPPTATPLPGSPDAAGPPPPAAAPAPAPAGSGKARETGPPSPKAEGAGRSADDGRDASGDGTTGSRRPWSARRRWVPALALVVTVLVATLYVLRPSGGDSAPGADTGVVVDLRDVGNRTVSLGRAVTPLALLQDDDTLWVKSEAAASGAELSKIDLTTGEEVANVPFPESDTLGTITAGAGSLWVTTSSAEDMSGAVVRIDPVTGDVVKTIVLPAWPGRAVFSAGSLWVATVVQPAAAEIGASEGAMSSAANALQRIDPETNEIAASIGLDAMPVDVGASDGLLLVSTASAEETAVVAIDATTEQEVAHVPVPEGAEAAAEGEGDPDAAGPWMLFVADPYAVRIDVDAEAVAAVTGPRDGIDMLVPDGDMVWELRAEVLTIIDGTGEKLATVTIDGTPLAAAAAGREAAWIAYRPSGSDEVLVTRVPAAELIDLSD